MGGLVTVNDQLVAIGGEKTKKVEVLLHQKWNENKIKSVPSSTEFIVGSNFGIWGFSSLVINNKIYIFGKLI